jgi:threonine aldolase
VGCWRRPPSSRRCCGGWADNLAARFSAGASRRSKDVCERRQPHHLQRLPEDHANARAFAEALLKAGAPVELDLASVQTNIVVFHLPASVALDAPMLSARARDRGVLLNATGTRTMRAVTHLDVNRAQCERAAGLLAELLAG